jgi:hypothetical protein
VTGNAGADRSGRDWHAWHAAYDDPDSALSRRLTVVQSHVRDAFDNAPAGPIHVISMCSGQGRDLLGVLADHRRASDVRARLVELDPVLAADAHAQAAALGLDGIEVVTTDASVGGAYIGAVPADLVLACGVFGNIVAADVERTVRRLPAFCRPGAAVVWTRHRRPPDLTASVRAWFRSAGFEELRFDATDDEFFTVGSHRYAGAAAPPPVPLAGEERLFRFVAVDAADAPSAREQ